MEHIAVSHNKLATFLPPPVWNRLRNHRDRPSRPSDDVEGQSPVGSLQQSSPPHVVLDSGTSSPAMSDGIEETQQPADINSEVFHKCHICQRKFFAVPKIRQHYVTSHFARQILQRHTTSRGSPSRAKEKCMYCDHVAFPRHLLEHLG